MSTHFSVDFMVGVNWLHCVVEQRQKKKYDAIKCVRFKVDGYRRNVPDGCDYHRRGVNCNDTACDWTHPNASVPSPEVNFNRIKLFPKLQFTMIEIGSDFGCWWPPEIHHSYCLMYLDSSLLLSAKWNSFFLACCYANTNFDHCEQYDWIE